MKISGILALLILIVSVEASWLASAVHPVVLSLGAAFSALDVDVDPLLDGMKDLFTFKKSDVNKFTKEELDAIKKHYDMQNDGKASIVTEEEYAEGKRPDDKSPTGSVEEYRTKEEKSKTREELNEKLERL